MTRPCLIERAREELADAPQNRAPVVAQDHRGRRRSRRSHSKLRQAIDALAASGMHREAAASAEW